MEKKYHRYYLHRKVKQAGFTVNARERTVFMPCETSNFHAQLLIDKYKYIKQLQIFQL